MTIPADIAGPLVSLSHRYGGDPAFVLAGGGNTSAKRGGRLWVKASGHALATIGPEGFVEMDRARLQSMLDDVWPADAVAREALFIERVMAARTAPELGQRPSVESLLHHLLPQPLVVHTHPGVVNALACCESGEQLAAELFGDDVLWQPYVDPGLTLARALRDALDRRRAQPIAILLQNHGLIVGGDSADEIDAVTRRILSAVRHRLPAALDETARSSNSDLLALHAAAAGSIHPGLVTAGDDSPASRWLAGTPSGRAAAMAGPLTPDQIVYCRSVPLLIDAPAADLATAEAQWGAAWSSYESSHGVTPWVGLISGAGFITFRESSKLAEITRAVYADAANIYWRASQLGAVRVLRTRDRQFIEGWEVEAHRRSVMSQSAREKT